MNTLDNLRKAAKRWLKDLRASDTHARARLDRALPGAGPQPSLRAVQHALARERGFDSWSALVRAQTSGGTERHAIAANDLLSAYVSGDPQAMLRLQTRYGRSLTIDELRSAVRRRLPANPLEGNGAGDSPAPQMDLPQSRLLVAQEAGFDDWDALERTFASPARLSVVHTGLTDALAPLDIERRMILPVEMRATLPVRFRDGVTTTTAAVGAMLSACLEGDVDRVNALVAQCPALVLCDYNYMTPLHLAVREGHINLVDRLGQIGAANSNYVTYPYRETLITQALDRGHHEIATTLEALYAASDPARPEDEGGEILYEMDDTQRRFQKLLNGDQIGEVASMLEERPDLALNPFAFWSEGVLMMPAKRGARKMIDLLMRYGAGVPDVSKWGAWYYLWHYEVAAFLLDEGMDPNHMNCHHTSVLHDMAYKGDLKKAALLLDHGADVNAIDEEFRSTPLGLAARWGHQDMVRLLLDRGADPDAAGAAWATPLEWARTKNHAGVEQELRGALRHR